MEAHLCTAASRVRHPARGRSRRRRRGSGAAATVARLGGFSRDFAEKMGTRGNLGKITLLAKKKWKNWGSLGGFLFKVFSQIQSSLDVVMPIEH